MPSPSSEGLRKLAARIRRSTARGKATAASTWYVYLLQSEKYGTYYIGATTDPARRLGQHNKGRGGNHTRSRGPWRLLYSIECNSQSEALKLEAKMKRLPARHKAQAWRWTSDDTTNGDVQQDGCTTRDSYTRGSGETTAHRKG